MKNLLNQLMVAQNKKEETETADTAADASKTESVEWADISATDPQLDTEQTDINQRDTNKQPTPDTTATSDEVDTMAAERLLENVLNGLVEPTMVVDSAGRISHINRNACERFETTESAAVENSPSAVHGGEELVARVLSRGEEITERTETVVIDGTERTLSRTVTPFQDESGKIVGAMETATDITEKAREKEKTDQLEAYQEAVLDDLQDKLRRLAEGDLTLDSSVPAPPANFEEIRTVHDEFTQLNDHLTTAVDNYQAVLSRLTLLADDLDETSQELSANSEEVTASIEEISHSTEEMADGSQELAEQTDQADMAVSNLTAPLEEITASIQEIDAETSQARALADEGV